MTETIVVEPAGGDRLLVRIGRHGLVLDQPLSDGGSDSGPTPTELFVAGYAACVAHYGGRYLRRHGLPTEGFDVRCVYRFSDDPPPRVEAIEIDVRIPGGLSGRDGVALRRVMERCTVGNTLRDVPRVRISYHEPVAAGAGREVDDVLEHPARG